jgi:hypothetical protein
MEESPTPEQPDMRFFFGSSAVSDIDSTSYAALEELSGHQNQT